MNTLQYYLTKLAEEASEVAQIALKTQQFGPNEVRQGQMLTNFERCHLELDDLFAVVVVLNEKFDFNYVPEESAVYKKQQKMLKYLDLSISLGMVNET